MATAGETTAPSRMKQSFAVGGALLQLVRGVTLGRFDSGKRGACFVLQPRRGFALRRSALQTANDGFRRRLEVLSRAGPKQNRAPVATTLPLGNARGHADTRGNRCPSARRAPWRRRRARRLHISQAHANYAQKSSSACAVDHIAGAGALQPRDEADQRRRKWRQTLSVGFRACDGATPIGG
jgi:hypothetical protein